MTEPILGDVLGEQVDAVLELLRRSVAEIELARKNVNSFIAEAESLIRGLADLVAMPSESESAPDVHAASLPGPAEKRS